ncbi:hypothetical protein ACFLZZ_00290 [Nanoarchaeota archaeon]
MSSLEKLTLRRSLERFRLREEGPELIDFFEGVCGKGNGMKAYETYLKKRVEYRKTTQKSFDAIRESQHVTHEDLNIIVY